MIRKLTRGILVLLILFFNIELVGQDPVFSSFFNNPLYYNPAAPGVTQGNEFRVNFREQWPGIPSGLRAFNFSSMHEFCGLAGLGIIASSNVEGESRMLTNNIGISIAVPVRLSRRFIFSTGITTSFGQKRIDWSRVEFDDQFDKLYGKLYPTSFPFPDDVRKNYGDLSFGFALKGSLKQGISSSKIYGTLGAAFHHMAVFPNPNFIGTNINAIPFKVVAHGNIWLLDKKQNKGFSPALIYEKQGNMETFNFSVHMISKPLYVLFGFRNTNYQLSLKKYDSFIFGFGYMSQTLNKKSWRIGYSYDFTVSRLLGGAYGSHEIFMVYNLDGCNDLGFGWGGKAGHLRRERYRDIECPSFGGFTF